MATLRLWTCCAAVEIMSFAAVIGGDVMALQTVKQCCRDVSAACAPTPPASASGAPVDARYWALALGAIHRAVGGIVLRTCLAEVVTALMAYSKSDAAARSTPGSSVFALHALHLVMSSAFGPARCALQANPCTACLLRRGAHEDDESDPQ